MPICAYRLSPTPSIYNLVCTPPLEIRRLKKSLNHELKRDKYIKSTLSTLNFKPMFQMLPTLLQDNNLDISKIFTIVPNLT